MQYVKRLPQTDSTLSEKLEKAGWSKIKEPKNLPLAILFAYPFLILLCGTILFLGYFLNPEIFRVFTADTLSIRISFDIRSAIYIVGLFCYTVLHELIHGVFIPNFFTSDKIFWGFNGLLGFVYTQEPMKKSRFILVSCMPCVLLSFVALPVAYLSGLLNGYTFLLFLVNAGGSCVDFLNIALIAFQVKGNRMIINNGFETYHSPV